MDLSIVTSMYCSAPYIREFCERSKSAAERITSDYEIILVNDGSPDDSLQIAVELHRSDARITVVDLSRNFGHHKALMTGLAYARGETVFLLDSDLEEEPELLATFHRRLQEGDCDVVYGYQMQRKGGWVGRIAGLLFYRAFNWLAGIDLPNNLTSARLMSRRYVENLLRFREREVFLAGLWHITGFTQVGLPVHKHFKGSSTYNLKRKIEVVVNGLTSFSVRPLWYIFICGVCISIGGATYIAYIIYTSLFRGYGVQGWPSLIASVWFLSGLNILFVGIIGVYLSKIYIETKRRPYVIVRSVYRHSE